MVRPGKEPAHSAAPSGDELASQATVQEGRWRAGVNRQSQDSALQHQHAAGRASGAKRKAEAMSDAERKRRRAAHKVEVRAAAKRDREKKAAEAASRAEAEAFATALQHVVEAEALGRLETLDFEEWLHHKELTPDEGTLEEWRDSDSYERSKRERIVEGCTCFLEPNGDAFRQCTCTYDGHGDESGRTTATETHHVGSHDFL